MSRLPSLFPSDYAYYSFIIAFAAWAVSEVVGGMVIPILKRRGASVRRGSGGSGVALYLAWVAVIAASSGLAGGGVLLLPDWFSYVGVLLMLAGVALRQWAIAVLGRYFSGTIGVQEGQGVVETGPYHLIRHPSYAGVLLILVGIAASMRSLVAMALAALIFALAYGYRMRVEEKVLIKELGESYVKYMRRTKRVIPFLL